MKNTDKPKKQVFCLLHSFIMDFFNLHGYSIIFPLLIAFRARSVTSTSCTPNMAV